MVAKLVYSKPVLGLFKMGLILLTLSSQAVNMIVNRKPFPRGEKLVNFYYFGIKLFKLINVP